MRIDIDGLSKSFGDFAALQDVSLEVPEGSLTALLGPSGSGKSTLLRIIAGLETPDAGTVSIDGADVSHVPAAEAWDRVRVPALCGVHAHERARERRLRAADPQAPRRRDQRPRRRAAGAGRSDEVGTAAAVAAVGRPAPADGAGPGARGRAPACCCSTSRSGRWTRPFAPSCGHGCGGSTTSRA